MLGGGAHSILERYLPGGSARSNTEKVSYTLSLDLHGPGACSID